MFTSRLGLTSTCSLAALIAGLPIAAALAVAATSQPAPAACAPGFDIGTLSARDRGFAARRLLLCDDEAHGRLAAGEYRARTDQLDSAWGAQPAPAPPLAVAPVVQWASAVRGVSSEYTATSWAAQRVLGAPDVYPASGDNAQAWASLGADTGPEWIEVGYAQPTPISAVKIFETYNPGAVSRVELVTASGARLVAYSGAAHAIGEPAREQRIDVACTREPIVAVRVELDSAAVPGWNELDAIGVVPCDAQ